MPKKLTQEEFIQKSRLIHGDIILKLCEKLVKKNNIYNNKKSLTMKYLKLFENFTQEKPEIITVKFNGDGFINQYWKGTEGDKVYQAHGFASNLKNLEGEGHHNYGDGGLEMRKGYYYPLFKENSKNSIWYYIVYSGDEINIIQSSEHSDQGIDIPNSFNSLKNITNNWYCKFDEGVTPGTRDHRGYFEIVSVR